MLGGGCHGWWVSWLGDECRCWGVVGPSWVIGVTVGVVESHGSVMGCTVGVVESHGWVMALTVG